MQPDSPETERVEIWQLAGVSGLYSGLNIKLTHNTINEHRQLANENKDLDTSWLHVVNLREKLIRLSWNFFLAVTGREALWSCKVDSKKYIKTGQILEKLFPWENNFWHGRNTGHAILNIPAHSPNIAWYICHTIACRFSAESKKGARQREQMVQGWITEPVCFPPLFFIYQIKL